MKGSDKFCKTGFSRYKKTKFNIENLIDMKKISKHFMFYLFLALIGFSCKKEEMATPPVITGMELGYENNKRAYPGTDLHIEAVVVAEGKIASIQVEIHPEGGHSSKSVDRSHSGPWEFDSAYGGKSVNQSHSGPWEFDSAYGGKYAGVKNTVFHEHIDIPATADTGIYHFHFIVTDMEGGQTVFEDELYMIAPTDPEAPVISVNSAPVPGQPFSHGQTISISGIVTDNIAIGGIYIGLVAVEQGLADAMVNHGNTISILHTHDFPDPRQVAFEAQLVVGAAFDNDIPSPKPVVWESGDYYILIKSPDAYGGNVAFSQHYPIVIQ